MQSTIKRPQTKVLSRHERLLHLEALKKLGKRKDVCRICNIHQSSFTHYGLHGVPAVAAIRIKLAREELGLTVEEMREVLEIICPVIID